jgi:hypothetical protein
MQKLGKSLYFIKSHRKETAKQVARCEVPESRPGVFGPKFRFRS